jgi:hypothetical protein
MSDETKVLCYVDGCRAYFITPPLSNLEGDDSNDAPYEHNFSGPYNADYEIVVWFGGFLAPCDGVLNSAYSVDDINAHHVPWLRPERWNDTVGARPIFAGVTMAEFKRLIREGGGDIYVYEAAP